MKHNCKIKKKMYTFCIDLVRTWINEGLRIRAKDKARQKRRKE